MRPPSCGRAHNGGWVAPRCFMSGNIMNYVLNGFMIVRGEEVLHSFIAETREGAEAYATTGETKAWKDFEAQGWRIIPVRVTATRIDA